MDKEQKSILEYCRKTGIEKISFSEEGKIQEVVFFVHASVNQSLTKQQRDELGKQPSEEEILYGSSD